MSLRGGDLANPLFLIDYASPFYNAGWAWSGLDWAVVGGDFWPGFRYGNFSDGFYAHYITGDDFLGPYSGPYDLWYGSGWWGGAFGWGGGYGWGDWGWGGFAGWYGVGYAFGGWGWAGWGWYGYWNYAYDGYGINTSVDVNQELADEQSVIQGLSDSVNNTVGIESSQDLSPPTIDAATGMTTIGAAAGFPEMTIAAIPSNSQSSQGQSTRTTRPLALVAMTTRRPVRSP